MVAHEDTSSPAGHEEHPSFSAGQMPIKVGRERDQLASNDDV